MSTRDVDRLLVTWLDSDAPASEPDHLLEAVLARTARTRRRPGWSIPERWLSVQLTMRWRRAPSLAPVVVVMALIAALIVVALIAGTRPRVPPPFGVAGTGLVAFVDEAQIWVANADGTEARRLTVDAVFKGRPVWSRDGRWIAYLGYAAQDSIDRASLTLVRADGSGAITLVRDAAFISTPSWSPDGSTIAFSYLPDGSARHQVFVADVDGASSPRPVGPEGRSMERPGFTHDGRSLIAVEVGAGRSTLVAVDIATGGVRAISSPHGRIGGDMEHGSVGHALSPDGSQVLFSAGDDETLRDLFVVGLDGTGETRIAGTALLEYGASWSPTGTRIAYLLGDFQNFPDVIVAAADGTDPASVATQSSWFAPEWSPDGRLLSVAGRGGTVWIVDVASPQDPVRIQTDPRPGSEPTDTSPGLDSVTFQRVAAG